MEYSSAEPFSTLLETDASDADSTRPLSFEDSPIVRIETPLSDKFNDSKEVTLASPISVCSTDFFSERPTLDSQHGQHTIKFVWPYVEIYLLFEKWRHKKGRSLRILPV